MVPRGGASCKGSPHAGSPFLQHHLYSPSALGLDVPPCCGLQQGSRGDSMRGLVHTSPIRPRAVARWGLGSHTPQCMYTPPPPMAAGPAAKKNAAVVVAHNSGRVFALSNGGCNPRNEPISRPRYRNVCHGARCSGLPWLYCTVDVGVLSTPRYRDSPLCHPNECAAIPPGARIRPPLHRIECTHHPAAFQPNNQNPGYDTPRFPTNCN